MTITVNSVTGQKNSVHVTSQGDLNPAPVVAGNSKVTLNLNVDSHVANAHIVTGLPQRKGVSPTFCQMYTEIKYVKNAYCVGHLSSVNFVNNAPHAVTDPPVGARLHQCWEKWEALGSSPKVVTTLKEGYTLPFWFRPHLTRSPTVISIPSWNLSLVLHQLTKAPFEPLKEASLKHLTFKTIFLLALGSGKHRSEIHAWLHKNIRHQSDWSKVSLYLSPRFLSKNQLAKEGPDSVAPVVIPALAPSLDRSLKGDRSLYPVRALHYYLDRTSDLRQNKELVFVSFKKGFNKDISPATISSWIKQTVVLCYELSDQEALTLHQVKAHDVRAFAASKAFQSGISLEQILSACHWKSHNTFTQFYLKDVAWADSELFHLGPVVAA